jgi:hypothetical protein
MKKAIIALVLIAAMSATAGQAFTLPVAAKSSGSTGTAAPRLVLISTITLSLPISGTSASYSLNVSCDPSVNSIGATLQLQKQSSNSTWSDYGTSWTASAATFYLSTSGTKAVASGYTYRLKVVVTASNGTSAGSATAYS